MNTQHAYSDVFDSLNEPATLLTPNRRLAATLHTYYQADQVAATKTHWPTLDILPLNSFMQRLWQTYASQTFMPLPILLTPEQEYFVWETILTAADQHFQLLQLSKTADTAKSAWLLLQQWQLDLHHPGFYAAEDAQALQKWCLSLQEKYAKACWIDQALLMPLLTEKINNQEIELPKKIMLLGFTELSPALKTFMIAAETQGTKITIFKPINISKAEPQRVRVIDAKQEWITMARWAKTTLASHPKARIGCVIADIDTRRDRIAAIFTSILEDKTLFNISAGKSLSLYPVVHTALQLLMLYKNKISRDIFSYLLLSPYLGDAQTEYINRARVDQQLRRYNFSYVKLKNLLNAKTARQPIAFSEYCPKLAARLNAFYTLQGSAPSQQSHAAWAYHFNTLLKQLGWPGERSLHSEEYQVVESWLQLLANYMTLDHVNDQVSMAEALTTLQKMASKSIFQPQSPPAPIQLLGTLEAAGLPFDYLWVSGMDDLTWPPQPQPNPFIPKSLQRELGMPHATAERELTFCNKLIEQFKTCASHVIFSYAEKQDALILQASTLIRNVVEINLDELNLSPYTAPNEFIFQKQQNERLIDTQAPAVTTSEKITGGINIIKYQALCPFKSFATWRLYAKPLNEPVYGLRAEDRGTLIHAVFEKIWNHIQTQAALLALTHTELHHIIDDCIDLALHDFPHAYVDYKNYIGLEKIRLHKLVQQWLNVEKSRPPFEVHTHENKVEITLNALTLATRIDRIDVLADGKRLIIDYKTGKNNDIASWFGERPDEPQLPVYLLTDKNQTAGITFAQVALSDACFKGISQYDIDIPGIKTLDNAKKVTAATWEEQISMWETTLTQLSDHFCHGQAQVNPKDAAQTCLWCELQPLCRINEKEHAPHE